jgi:AraC-like DNA-binding protein
MGTLPLEITFIGKDYPQEPAYQPEGDGFYRFLYCKKGVGEVIIDGMRSLAYPGQVTFISAGHPFSYRSFEGEWTVDLFAFAGGKCKEILEQLDLTQSGVYQLLQSDFFFSYLEEAITLKDTLENRLQTELSKLAYRFLLDIRDHMGKIELPSPQNRDTVPGRIITYLEKHYDESFSLDTLAEEIGLSKAYMCALFHKETGQTIISYLTSIRIGKARFFLEQYPDKDVYEIGFLCGYENPSYFGKKFKAATGVTPENYRIGRAIRL